MDPTIVVVVKKDKSLRICVDYLRLNALSEMDAHAMSRIDEVIDRLCAASFISTTEAIGKFLCHQSRRSRQHLLLLLAYTNSM